LKRITKILYGGLALGALIVHVSIAGGTAALAHALGPWAYPTHFGIGMAQMCLVLVLLLPSRRRTGDDMPWWQKKLTIGEDRFSKGVWPWVRKRGAFALVLAGSLLVGPFFAGVVIRFLGLDERKAWVYGFVTTAIGSVFWISVYLGAVAWIRSLLANLLQT
jgi:uncharacterized membrane protein YeaQ/YmgE (transglycosylase-associated protein family)